MEHKHTRKEINKYKPEEIRILELADKDFRVMLHLFLRKKKTQVSINIGYRKSQQGNKGYEGLKLKF